MEGAEGLGNGAGKPSVSGTPEVHWATRGARKELFIQIAGVEPPRMAIAAAQERLAIKMMKNPSVMRNHSWG